MNIYEEFPQGLFPPVIENYIQDSARAQGLCSDFLYSAFISVLSVLMGNNYSAKITGQWIERPLVWIALVGQSGIKKTPAIKAMFSPLNEIEKINYREYKQKLTAYEEAVKLGDTECEKPKSKQMIVDDTTMEALYDVLKRNGSGVIMKKDELMALIYDAGRYSKSNGNEEKLLSIFSGVSISINRKGNDLHDLIERPFVSLIGGIQPEVLKKLFADGRADNGFVNRLLFTAPEELVRKMPMYAANNKLPVDYDDYIKRAYLKNLKITDGQNIRIIVPLSDEALEAFKAWQGSFIYGEQFDVSFDGYLSKLEAYAVRLALLIEYAHSIPKDGMAESISLDSMNKGIELCYYFFQTYQRARTMQESSPNQVKEDKTKATMTTVIHELQKNKSMKDIVLRLLNQGCSNADIHRGTLIPKPTISSWAKEL